MTRPLWAPWRLEYVGSADEQDGCIFCRALEGADEDGLVVHRGERAFVLLNRFPYASGHLMVAPKRHTGDFGALEADEVVEIHRLASQGMGALAQVYEPQGYNLGWNLGRIAGAGIMDHIHLHLVPRWAGDTNFMPVLADVKVLPEHLMETRSSSPRPGRRRSLAASPELGQNEDRAALYRSLTPYVPLFSSAIEHEARAARLGGWTCRARECFRLRLPDRTRRKGHAAPAVVEPAARQLVPGRRRKPGRRSARHRLAGPAGRRARPPQPRSQRTGLGLHRRQQGGQARPLGLDHRGGRRQPGQVQHLRCLVGVRSTGRQRLPLPGVRARGRLIVRRTWRPRAATTFITFELNHDPRLWNNGRATIPCRSTGDVLVSYEAQGNDVSVVIQRWVTTQTDPASGCATTGHSRTPRASRRMSTLRARSTRRRFVRTCRARTSTRSPTSASARRR